MHTQNSFNSDGRGCGCGCGRGRGIGTHTRMAADATQVLCLGNGQGVLAPYSGLCDDARLQNYKLFQMFPTCTREMTTVPLRDQLLEPQHARVLEKALTPGVRWKIQFGAQLVYFGRRGGLSGPAEFEERHLSEQELTKLIDGPFRSSFTTHEFSDCEAILAFLCERIPAERVKHEYVLRFTEKNADTGIICYDRVGATREEVLDDREFTTAAPFFDDIRLGNFVYVLPASGREETIEDYVLFRAHVIEPRRAAGPPRSVVVHRSDANGKFSVQFVNDTAVPSYTRLQERYVLRKAGSEAEIHVMANEESGATVTQRGAKIRVELHCEPTRARSTDWEDFIAFAEVLAGLLEELS